MHSCQDINTWDQPMSHWGPTHDHLGLPLAMTRPSILSVMTSRPEWRCRHDPSRHHRPSIPEIKNEFHQQQIRYEEQYDTIEKLNSLYSLYHPAESDHWGGINPGFKLEPIIKIIFSKLRLRKWIMRACDQASSTADHAHKVTHDFIIIEITPLRYWRHYQAFWRVEGLVRDLGWRSDDS